MNTLEARRNTTINPTHPHIASLDGLRFIAAGTVLFAHAFYFILLLEQPGSITPYNSPFVGLAIATSLLSSVRSAASAPCPRQCGIAAPGR